MYRVGLTGLSLAVLSCAGPSCGRLNPSYDQAQSGGGSGSATKGMASSADGPSTTQGVSTGPGSGPTGDTPIQE